jgi:hypothetical protein
VGRSRAPLRGQTAVSDPAAEFFAELARRGTEPLLLRAKGTLRIELMGGRRSERWIVAIDKGAVTVSRRNGAADCVVRAEKSLFDLLVTGRANATAALLRGALAVEGDANLLVLFQRLFPGPPRSRKQKRTRSRAGRRARGTT